MRCALVHGRQGVLARGSAVQKSPLLVAGEIREIQGRNDELIILLSQVTAVREEWLRELFPEDLVEKDQVFLDPVARRVQAKRDLVFRDLILHTTRLDMPKGEVAEGILAREVISGRYPLSNWSHDVDQWIIRLNSLACWFPELDLPTLDEEARFYLVEQICHGALSYKDIKDRSVWPVVRAWLSPTQQQMLEQFIPKRIELPNGRKAKLQYVENQPPVLAARIQDLYGVDGSLKICDGRVTVLVHILAPNHHPIQITQDLSTFWKEFYPKAKQELQRRYPKHEWC